MVVLFSEIVGKDIKLMKCEMLGYEYFTVNQTHNFVDPNTVSPI